jgi:hypothetical protein
MSTKSESLEKRVAFVKKMADKNISGPLGHFFTHRAKLATEGHKVHCNVCNTTKMYPQDFNPPHVGMCKNCEEAGKELPARLIPIRDKNKK